MAMIQQHTLLEPEQQELLCKMVEAQQSRPRGLRQKFMLFHGLDSPQPEFTHPGLSDNNLHVYEGDLDALEREGLLSVVYGNRGTPTYDITPQGYQYYRELRQAEGSQAERTESTVIRYLNSDAFAKAHPIAARKWGEAEALLLSEDITVRLTNVGHLCREAMQCFATDIVKRVNPPQVTPEEIKTKARLRAAIDHAGGNLGSSLRGLLNASLDYWAALNDYVQRQEHGSKNPDRPLSVEDAKRCVLHTAMVMFEVDAALADRNG